jgi:hypothetical protein
MQKGNSRDARPLPYKNIYHLPAINSHGANSGGASDAGAGKRQCTMQSLPITIRTMLPFLVFSCFLFFELINFQRFNPLGKCLLYISIQTFSF